MARLTGLEPIKLTSAMYENRCLYTYIYVLAELNGGLKRYRLWSICDPDHKNTNEI